MVCAGELGLFCATVAQRRHRPSPPPREHERVSSARGVCACDELGPHRAPLCTAGWRVLAPVVDLPGPNGICADHLAPRAVQRPL